MLWFFFFDEPIRIGGVSVTDRYVSGIGRYTCDSLVFPSYRPVSVSEGSNTGKWVPRKKRKKLTMVEDLHSAGFELEKRVLRLEGLEEMKMKIKPRNKSDSIVKSKVRFFII
ncbi:hypothetical protein RHMOL_Rhmol03G0182600 [Rhododendron molle]|uniref:Uncharacterized protein n=1 Tax=Rhododendron molle TaxID=49168 RepID=A0ACC0PH23_RHOML|nr:hypothetical protein RHMOL_Rhmol03G0182600 [Rhododendron molle]